MDYGFVGKDGQAVTSRNIQKEWFRRISYIPQSSMSSMNPVVRIRNQFVDFLDPAQDKKVVLEKVRDYVKQLGLPAEAIDAYPHQLSGGMRQRIMVAMVTFFQPEIILADEPTTALDVVVQKGILLLLMELQEEMKNTIIFVLHDMGSITRSPTRFSSCMRPKRWSLATRQASSTSRCTPTLGC